MGLNIPVYEFTETTPAADPGFVNAKPRTDGGFPIQNWSWEVPSTGGIDPRTTTTETIGASDRGKLVTFNNASPIAVTLDSTVAAGFMCWVAVLNGSAQATFTPSSGTVNGQSNVVLQQNQSATVFFDGTNWIMTVAPAQGLIGSIGITIDGGGSVLTTGSKGFFQIQYSGTILGVTLLADQAGSVQFDIRKSTFSAFPTNSSIVAADPPALSAAQKSNDTTLTGWTTVFSDGDIFEYKVSSAATVTRVNLILRVKRS